MPHTSNKQTEHMVQKLHILAVNTPVTRMAPVTQHVQEHLQSQTSSHDVQRIVKRNLGVKKDGIGRESYPQSVGNSSHPTLMETSMQMRSQTGKKHTKHVIAVRLKSLSLMCLESQILPGAQRLPPASGVHWACLLEENSESPEAKPESEAVPNTSTAESGFSVTVPSQNPNLETWMSHEIKPRSPKNPPTIAI